MSAQSSYLNKKGLTVKDLVTIGIFTALFFVFELIGSLPFAPNPALTFYQPFGIALLCGPVYLLMVAKVPKRGVSSFWALSMELSGMYSGCTGQWIWDMSSWAS